MFSANSGHAESSHVGAEVDGISSVVVFSSVVVSFLVVVTSSVVVFSVVGVSVVSVVVVSSVVVFSVVGVSVVSVSHKTHPAFAGQSQILSVGLKCNSDGQDLRNGIIKYILLDTPEQKNLLYSLNSIVASDEFVTISGKR